IGTLYANDNINVALHEIKIWTTDDPYDGTYGENLEEFKNKVTEFNGDLAHLVNNPSTTSVAYLNSLCTDWRYAYSGISMNYAQVPTYSWTIMAMTHEMGHSLGSPHTHNCSWNGNNTAIDGCGPAAGYTEGTCPQGPIPPSSVGGTIMSYCHLTSSTIKFVNGFGPQPQALIVNSVNGAACLDVCGSDCAAPIASVSFNGTDATISWANVGAVSYDLQWKLSTSGTWTSVNGITGTSHELNGLTVGTSYDYRVRSNCTGL